MAKKYVKAYYDWVEQMEALSDSEKGRLFVAILKYGKTGTVKGLRGNERFLFPTFKAQIDRASESGSSGERHWNWKGGITPANQMGRSSKPYKQWRLSVFRRDEYTCQRCFKRGGRLNAHHIERWADNHDRRYDLSNGITLCASCHKKVHEGGK